MELADRIEGYLTEKLYPFWYQRVAAPDGGFTTYFDRSGKPTGQTDKTIIQQTRSIFMLSHAIRNGYGAGKAGALLQPGLEWFLKTFKDPEHEGWLWIVDKNGTPVSTDKIMYGQSFVIYCMSECALATGSAVARKTAEETFTLVQKYAADTALGRVPRDVPAGLAAAAVRGVRRGPQELRRAHAPHGSLHDPVRADPRGHPQEEAPRGDRRPVDAHVPRAVVDGHRAVHPGLHAASRHHVQDGVGLGQGQRRGTPAAEQHQLRPQHRVPVAVPARAVGAGNIPDPGKKSSRRLPSTPCATAWTREYGGIFVEGPHDGPARDMQKEFWQQAESLVGLLDGYLLFKDRVYWDAFRKVFDFVWGRMINHDVGEWFALLDRDGTVKWDYLGHAWKNNYHTTRSMVQTLRRLKEISRRGMET